MITEQDGNFSRCCEGIAQVALEHRDIAEAQVRNMDPKELAGLATIARREVNAFMAVVTLCTSALGADVGGFSGHMLDDGDYMRHLTWLGLQRDERGDAILARLRKAVTETWAGTHPSHSAREALRVADQSVISSVDNLADLAVRETLFALGLIADREGWYPSGKVPRI